VPSRARVEGSGTGEVSETKVKAPEASGSLTEGGPGAKKMSLTKPEPSSAGSTIEAREPPLYPTKEAPGVDPVREKVRFRLGRPPPAAGDKLFPGTALAR